ncbi:hypothetical protein BH23PAT2_BH23PAT2_02840 [soil metagenome]
MTDRYKTPQRQYENRGTDRNLPAHGATRLFVGAEVSAQGYNTDKNEVIRNRPARRSVAPVGSMTGLKPAPVRNPDSLVQKKAEVGTTQTPLKPPVQPDVPAKSTPPPARTISPTSPSRRVARRSNVLHRKTVVKQLDDQRKTHKSQQVRTTALRALKGLAIGLMIVGGLFAGGRYTHSYLQQPNPQVLSETAATSSAVSTADAETVAPSEEVPKHSAVEQHEVAPNHPRYIRINSIDMEARVHSLGVDSTNQLLVPESIFDVGWYNGSRLPGQTGAVVMNGYVSGPSTRGVFYYLKALVVGDTIEIERGDGEIYQYEVVKKEAVPFDNFEVSSVLVPFVSGKNGLNLVTYDGRFNVLTGDYQDRLVVYAVEL